MTPQAPIGSGRRPLLAADIGGTNTRFALAGGGSVLAGTARRFKNSGIRDLSAAAQLYLRDIGEPALAGACVAVAGPVIDGHVRLTNISWQVDARTLSRSLGGIRVLVINDLQAVAHALHLLRPDELTPLIRGEGQNLASPRLVINAGTGFNAVAVHDIENRRFAAPSECGHSGLPADGREASALREHIESRFGFAAIEDVLSGRGAELVRRWVSRPDTAGAAERADPETAYHRILAEMLGAAARDLALTHLPFGGIFLTGGLIQAIAPHLTASGFAEKFQSAGRFSDLMRRFSVWTIRDDMAALRGCGAAFDQDSGASRAAADIGGPKDARQNNLFIWG